MLRAFRLNLTALSAIALLVSLFLVYNAVSLSVLERRRQIGILRSLGLTRSAVAALFAAEGMALGLLGSLLGSLGPDHIDFLSTLGSIRQDHYFILKHFQKTAGYS